MNHIRICLLVGVAATSSCRTGTTPMNTTPGVGSGGAVTVPLMPKSESTLAGKAEFTETGSGVKVRVEVSGVTPGKHGVHIHEKADCSAPDATSAGGHFNPGAKDHAVPPTDPRHLGDLGNIEVGEDGTGVLEAEAPGANMKDGDPTSFRARAIIVHASADDGGQPVGNAGGRIGCGELN